MKNQIKKIKYVEKHIDLSDFSLNITTYQLLEDGFLKIDLKNSLNGKPKKISNNTFKVEKNKALKLFEELIFIIRNAEEVCEIIDDISATLTIYYSLPSHTESVDRGMFYNNKTIESVFYNFLTSEKIKF